MKPTLEHLRLSAEFCKKELADDAFQSPPKECWIWAPDLRRWNPPENAGQDRELELRLREARWETIKTPLIVNNDGFHYIRSPSDELEYRFHCHPNDFLTLAAAKLQEMKDDT